jgi:phytoene dehydrogenase-like protein
MDSSIDKQGPDKICIIGAGISGLTAGALLSKKGYHVEIYEKAPLLGGRALSLDGSTLTESYYNDILTQYHSFIAFAEPSIKEIIENGMLKGYSIDLGYHAIGGGVFSNLNSVLEEFDEHIDFLESSVGFVQETGYRFPFLSTVDKIKILPNILRLLFASEKTLNKLDTVSITETIRRYGKGKMKLILEIFSRSITTVNDLDRISTGEMFRAQRNLYRGSKPVGYPKKGLGHIHETLAQIISKQGGSIHLNSRIESIIIEDNKAKGIIINGERHEFDIIVSSVLLQDLFSLVDTSLFPDEYVRTLTSLTGTGSLSGYYCLEKMPKTLIGKTFHFLERNVGVEGDDAVGMIDFMAADETAGITPPGVHLVQSYIICTPDEAKDKETLHRLREMLDKNLKQLIPDYKDQLIWAMYPSVWHLDGVAKTIDNPKPTIHTPIQSLYVIGDGVKAMGIGFNGALNSARLLYSYLLGE